MSHLLEVRLQCLISGAPLRDIARAILLLLVEPYAPSGYRRRDNQKLDPVPERYVVAVADQDRDY